MFNDDLSKISRIEVTIDVLSQALCRLHEHDYPSAQVMVAIARQALEDVQLDFDLHFQAEEMLEQILNQSLS